MVNVKHNKVIFIGVTCLLILIFLFKTDTVSIVGEYKSTPTQSKAKTVEIKSILDSKFKVYTKSFMIKGMPVKELNMLLDTFIKENPKYKYLMTKYSLKRTLNGVQINIDWLLTKQQEDRIYKYVADVVTKNKEEKLEDRLIYYANIIMDQAEYTTEQKDLDVSLHSPYSIVKNKVGVCQAYSLLYKYFLDYEGLDNILVEGTTTENHLWNLVKINSSYYHIDITYMDTQSTKEREYQNMLLSDIQLTDRQYLLPNDIKADSIKYVLLNKNYLHHTNDVSKIIELDSKNLNIEVLSQLLDIKVDNYSYCNLKDLYGSDLIFTDSIKNTNYSMLVVRSNKNLYYYLADIR